jgi:hypothetical protein
MMAIVWFRIQFFPDGRWVIHMEIRPVVWYCQNSSMFQNRRSWVLPRAGKCTWYVLYSIVVWLPWWSVTNGYGEMRRRGTQGWETLPSSRRSSNIP